MAGDLHLGGPRAPQSAFRLDSAKLAAKSPKDKDKQKGNLTPRSSDLQVRVIAHSLRRSFSSAQR